MDITNSSQLKQVLQTITKQAINNSSKRISQILANQIDRDVYGSHGPNQVYYDGLRHPTGQFKEEAWPWSDTVTRGIDRVVKELFYDYTPLVFDGPTFLHGSTISGDASKYLAAILNQDTKLSSLWITVDRGTDHRFWENFLKKVFDKDYIGTIFEEELHKLGFIVERS